MKKVFVYVLVIVFSFSLWAPQKTQAQLSKAEIEGHQKAATQLVKYLEFTLNLIGKSETSAKDKETIINESFLKIFQDGNVQVEDDLDEFRTVPTNKNVQAYLKDIDFFFREVKFRFTIEDVTHQINESSNLYFRFQINRNLRAKYFNGDTINSNKIRFIEINFDDEKQDLKIASIYTTKLNEKEELQNWWNEMPEKWKAFLAGDNLLNDSVKLADVFKYNDSAFITTSATNTITKIDTFLVFNNSDTLFIQETDTAQKILEDTIAFDADIIYQKLKRMVKAKEIIIPDSLQIAGLEPLSKFTNLEKLMVKGNPVENLIPLRNLIKLKYLDIRNTHITTLHPLRYASNLKHLDFSHTLVWDLSPVANFTFLENLYFNYTPIEELYPLSNLKYLKDLRFTNSNVAKMDSLKRVKSLENLHITSTYIRSVAPLKGLDNLKEIRIDSTLIGDLSPLEQNAGLIKIYCDHSNVTPEEANRFMTAKPSCHVIFESEKLNSWWADLDEAWKQAFRKYTPLDEVPSAEQLHELPKIKEIDISDQPTISTLEPLKKLVLLEHLTFNNTAVRNLDPLKELNDLKYISGNHSQVQFLGAIQNLSKIEYLDFSNSNVYETVHLEKLANLKELHIDNTNVASLESISLLPKLEKVYADKTKVDIIEAKKFRKRQPNVLLVFRTSELSRWWLDMNDTWENVFREVTGFTDRRLSPEELHIVSTIEKLNLNNKENLRNLNPLTTLEWLKELRFTDTRITQLAALKKMQSLELIECGNNPINDLSDIMKLPKLTYLDISNIPVEDFDQIQNMKNLETLICPGTQIKNLKGLEYLTKLKHLEIYNTKVKSINPIELLDLKLLKCYNTGISDKKIQNFKATHRKCEVIYY